ncbi:MAG TPA: Hsp20/alpha crystallin family protein [Verrucomicrobiae bacterium]|nr:Hsp20/alpha crystallin family protein [Verrucomicrobiae bacterium]
MSNLTRWQRPELAVWPAFDKLFGLRDELDRLFENPFGDWTRNSQLLSVWNPAIDLFEDADTVTVKAELPGMKKEEIEVSLHDGMLSISGERKSEQKYEDAQTHRSERFVGVFQRSITLPAAVKGDQVKAQYKDGILTVTLPKAEEAKRKQIEVKVN